MNLKDYYTITKVWIYPDGHWRAPKQAFQVNEPLFYQGKVEAWKPGDIFNTKEHAEIFIEERSKFLNT